MELATIYRTMQHHTTQHKIEPCITNCTILMKHQCIRCISDDNSFCFTNIYVFDSIHLKMLCIFTCEMNNYIVRSYRDVIVITKFAITKYAIRRASKAKSIK